MYGKYTKKYTEGTPKNVHKVNQKRYMRYTKRGTEGTEATDGEGGGKTRGINITFTVPAYL